MLSSQILRSVTREAFSHCFPNSTGEIPAGARLAEVHIQTVIDHRVLCLEFYFRAPIVGRRTARSASLTTRTEDIHTMYREAPFFCTQVADGTCASSYDEHLLVAPGEVLSCRNPMSDCAEPASFMSFHLRSQSALCDGLRTPAALRVCRVYTFRTMDVLILD